MTRREKLLVFAIPAGLTMGFLWFAWLQPRLWFHSRAGGGWSDYSKVSSRRIDSGAIVYSFQAKDSKAIEELIARFDLLRTSRFSSNDDSMADLRRKAEPRNTILATYSGRDRRRGGLVYLSVGSPTSTLLVVTF